MASLSKERGNQYRIQWRFKVRAGIKAGQTESGSVSLGRCSPAEAKARRRKIDEWEEQVKAGRVVPGGD